MRGTISDRQKRQTNSSVTAIFGTMTEPREEQIEEARIEARIEASKEARENAPLEISSDVLAILECLRDPAILLSPDYRILQANSAYQDLYGKTIALEHQHCYRVSHHYDVPCDQAGESCPLKKSMDTGENTRVLHIHHTPRGEEYVNVEMWPVKDPHSGDIRYCIEIMHPSSVASATGTAMGPVGRSRAFQRTLSLVTRVASSNATVMLLGESGTGKELLAETVHRLSERSGGPFVPVECTGMPEALFESELFGYTKGAFTGATHDKSGLVEAAAGGTLFLDEVGDIPLSEQVKLLRLLETRRFRRVGSTEWQDTDFRLVCATHRDLAAMVRSGEFREDLYYRLNVFEINIPPLRERSDDIAPLMQSMLSRIAPGRTIEFSESALATLERYDFPGNVRELRNLVERAVLLADDGVVKPEHFPDTVRTAKHRRPAGSAGASIAQADAGDAPNPELIPLADVEKNYPRRAVANHRGDRKSLAAALNISERALYRKLAELKND